MEHQKHCRANIAYVCSCTGKKPIDVCPYCLKIKSYCTGDFAGCHEREDNEAPHTHGEHGSHTETIAKKTGIKDSRHDEITEDMLYTDFIQFICLDDGVIYKELEITREVK